MTDDSKKNISISSGDVLVAEDKPVLIDEDKVRPQDELQEISVSDFSFPETDENTTVAGDDDTTITLECDTESEEYVEVDKGPHEDELHEEISLSDVIFLESDENTMPARDVVDLDITIEFDTESEEDEVDMDKAPQQDEVEERMELGKGQKRSVSDIFCPGEDENTMPLSNVDRNTTNERDKDENIFGGEFKKNISGGQVSQDISAGVVLVDRAKPVLADKDMPLIRSCSTGSVAVIFVITYKCFLFQHRIPP